MSLINKITVKQSNNGCNIVLADVTGVYNVSTNPGGYGSSQTPTNKRKTTDIVDGFVYVKNLKDNSTYNYTSINQTNAINIASGSTTYNIESSIFKSSNTIPYDDSVYEVKYKIQFSGINFLDFFQNSKTVVVSGDITEFINVKYLRVDHPTTPNAYLDFEITNVDQSGSNITLNNNWTLPDYTSNQTYDVYYEVISYVACYYNINKCIQKNISKIPLSSCSCNKKLILTLCDSVILLFSIDINMEKTKYNKALNTINLLTKYCSSNDCNCS